MSKQDIKKEVKKRYGKTAMKGRAPQANKKGCCGSSDEIIASSCCSDYSVEQLQSVPEGANLGLGCGNPVALASLKEGEVVLDLGSGAGFDCFLAAGRVGLKGKVIGIDMTPQMVDKATKLAKKNNYTNVVFKLAEIEELPVEANSVDVIISNCVINLSIDKASVFKESYRVLKQNGRIMISDIVLTRELPEFIKNSMEAYANCISGALLKNEYIKAIKDAGFKEINIIGEKVYPFDLLSCDPVVAEFLKDNKVEEAQLKEIASTILSIQVAARK